MKHKLSITLGLVAFVMIALVASPAKAQTTAAGPYYANPSWDQQLPASTRFIILSNWASAAVLDRETGLVWEKSPGDVSGDGVVNNTDRINWQDAQNHCNEKTVGGRIGWRLPTIQELASLVDPTVSSGLNLPTGHPFTNVQSTSFYWSATTSAAGVAASQPRAWALLFDRASVGSTTRSIIPFKDLPTLFGFVWCVRGGQGVDPQ